jgi:hypothetical protein
VPRSLLFGLAIGCALACSCPLGADAQARALSYEQHVARAFEALSAGELARAHEEFALAGDQRQSARALRGMGVVSFRSGDYARAWVELRAALLEPRMPLDAELRASVGELLARLHERLGFLELEVESGETLLVIDDAPVRYDAEKRVPLTEGLHELRGRGVGGEAVELAIVGLKSSSAGSSARAAGGVVVISVAAGTRSRLQVRAARAQASAAQPLTTGPNTLPGPAPSQDAPSSTMAATLPKPDRATTITPWAWVGLAAVPVFASVSAATWLQTQAIGDGLVERCSAGACTDRRRAELIRSSDLATFETLTSVGLGLTAAAAITATCLFVFGDELEASALAARARGGAAITGAW